MSLDVSLVRVQPTEVLSLNITHNLNVMAQDLGIYGLVWRPEENGIEEAGQLIEPLREAIKKMKENPDHYRKFDAANGYGTYDDFLPWLEDYLTGCEQYPDAVIRVSR